MFFCLNHGISDDTVTKITGLATVPKERLDLQVGMGKQGAERLH
jgi:bacterioferritin-associated ferredoxin